MRYQIQRFLSALRWRLTKPEYLFQPAAVLRRFRKCRGSGESPYLTVRLNWGLSLRVKTTDVLSSGILRTSVDDVTQSEIIWRLLSPGETAVDIGANIGYVSSIMAARVGRQGRVLAFEPHPGLCEELRTNVSAWRACYRQVEVYETALSERTGNGSLCVPPAFNENRGLSRVLALAERRAGETSFPIGLRRLDDIWQSDSPIALMKIDVEGHELAVLKGAQRLLGRKLIRNIVFEDFGGCESESMGLLKASGYTIWQIACELFGPRLLAAGARRQSPWLPSNYLASLTPESVQELVRQRGWGVLRTWRAGHHK
jgi:FkbM family methyltransferase